MKNCILIKTGLMEYSRSHDMQKRFLEKRIGKEIEDVFILTRHEPVVTAGRGFSPGNLLVPEAELEKNNIRLYMVERGGDATYHGPGQAIGYPIIDLDGYGRDLRWFIRSLEQVIIEALGDFGITGSRSESHAGVWAEGMKICSVGVAVRKWVTYHGFALNVTPLMEEFSAIKPCGLKHESFTSLETILGKHVPVDKAEEALTGHFAQIFKVNFKTSGEYSHA